MAHHLQELADARVEMPAVNQIFITPYNWKERSEIVALCKKHSIALEAYTSLFSLTKYKGGPREFALYFAFSIVASHAYSLLTLNL